VHISLPPLEKQMNIWELNDIFMQYYQQNCLSEWFISRKRNSSSYFWWYVRLFIGNFLAWLTYENDSCRINDELLSIWFRDDDDAGTECESLINGWTNANGFFLDFNREGFSFVDVRRFDCDINNKELFKFDWRLIRYDTSNV